MAPPRRKRLRRAAKAPVEAPGMAANDFRGQERRDLSGTEAVPEGNNPIPDKPGESSPSAGTFETDVGNEVQKMLERLGVDIKQALLTKRKMFEMGTKASIKTTNETIEHVWKLQQEQRQNLHLKYSQQFLTLFREWNVDMQKAQKQQEKLASMFQEQRKVLQQARVVQKQRLQKIKNLYVQFLESMQDLEKDHEHLLTDEQSEVREEMTKLQNKIMMEVQQQELAIVQKSLQSLLF
ncbi:synaptonemal complex protein 3-like isoform X1 [Panthera onca]|uniref:synaptonemal complex protein 3-like isoform X1 n=1 Tax=Panthera uncia TaxID=29064 RepID=UPI0009058EE9|nr:synaptonemal complex protein 3-like isoform X1 [Panthera uncia]XP_049479549.1 synaptonemal complex protein 3-like isoform X1 [Panthera uncia]XP_060484053.1 synaptonemal complex protein 3-like isoform X1 [Panthera onca]